ncbi:MAG: discoidin domain-containing protein [Deltaproteobacteria bacterium]|nr:discoidin domain-containing protein [Deltaproteobacteria bacterium]
MSVSCKADAYESLAVISVSSAIIRLANILRTVRRVRKARFFYEVGRGIAINTSGDRSIARAVRLWRKALRTLEPASMPPSNWTVMADEPTALRTSVATQLSASGIVYQVRLLRPYMRAIIVGGCVTGFLALLLLSVSPPIRHLVFPVDLAHGKPWTASSALGGFTTNGLVSDDSSPTKLAMFHTVDEQSPSITIDLGKVARIHKVRTLNRRDCCQERALPLAVEISTDQKTWRRVGYRRVVFSTWTVVFPRVRARYVRLRIDRPSALHLQSVSVY